MKVYWTDKARSRLRGIEQYIARESPLLKSFAESCCSRVG